MARYWTLEPYLPDLLTVPLFGDRKKYGQAIRNNDPEWRSWQDFYIEYYQNTQKRGVGKTVNDAGYAVLRSVDLSGKRVLEIGPGVLPHIRFWQGKPRAYTIVDVNR